jgi:spore coat polysaccharide biosynthesis protein SpsF (cytidylyltransferase family)
MTIYWPVMTESARTLEDIAAPWGFKVFAGSREDVLDRYIKAAENFGLDRLVRATGDNPLVSAELAGQLLTIVDALELQGGTDLLITQDMSACL